MKHCMECGTKLITRYLEDEGEIPYCETCGQFRFPVFSVAVSVEIQSPDRKKILLIKQYGKDRYILVAGYINKGENAEDTVIREVKEELSMTVQKLSFLRSHYYAPSETLMLLYAVTVSEKTAVPNREVDSWEWVPVESALSLTKPGGLAETFLLDYEAYRA